MVNIICNMVHPELNSVVMPMALSWVIIHLGPFTPQSDPLSYKLGGFSRGAGHGSTFQDKYNNWWHVSTSIVCVKNTFERRIGIWPAGFDKDEMMYCNTAFGDYPQAIPAAGDKKRFYWLDAVEL